MLADAEEDKIEDFFGPCTQKSSRAELREEAGAHQLPFPSLGHKGVYGDLPFHGQCRTGPLEGGENYQGLQRGSGEIRGWPHSEVDRQIDKTFASNYGGSSQKAGGFGSERQNFNQLTVDFYHAPPVLTKHFDSHNLFRGAVATVSLDDATMLLNIMQREVHSEHVANIPLPRGVLVPMTVGDARRFWTNAVRRYSIKGYAAARADARSGNSQTGKTRADPSRVSVSLAFRIIHPKLLPDAWSQQSALVAEDASSPAPAVEKAYVA
jgi:hypothetical protein